MSIFNEVRDLMSTNDILQTPYDRAAEVLGVPAEESRDAVRDWFRRRGYALVEGQPLGLIPARAGKTRLNKKGNKSCGSTRTRTPTSNIGLSTGRSPGVGPRSSTIRKRWSSTHFNCGISSTGIRGGQRIIRTYFSEGYLPWRVTVPSPDGTMRHVYLFDYWAKEAQ